MKHYWYKRARMAVQQGYSLYEIIQAEVCPCGGVVSSTVHVDSCDTCGYRLDHWDPSTWPEALAIRAKHSPDLFF